VRLLNVSNSRVRRREVDDKNGHTVKYRVGDQSTGVDDLVTTDRKRLAVSVLQIVHRTMLSLELP
jgi:hypothetical protein